MHQDVILLNYFSASHYGMPTYTLNQGYQRLYGPWLTFFTATSSSNPDATIAAAAVVAQANIDASIP